jgi:hypothetical protein
VTCTVDDLVALLTGQRPVTDLSTEEKTNVQTAG